MTTPSPVVTIPCSASCGSCCKPSRCRLCGWKWRRVRKRRWILARAQLVEQTAANFWLHIHRRRDGLCFWRLGFSRFGGGTGWRNFRENQGGGRISNVVEVAVVADAAFTLSQPLVLGPVGTGTVTVDLKEFPAGGSTLTPGTTSQGLSVPVTVELLREMEAAR